jgi:hypothetical protein
MADHYLSIFSHLVYPTKGAFRRLLFDQSTLLSVKSCRVCKRFSYLKTYVPACRYQLSFNTITTAGLGKRFGGLFGQTFFQQ